MHLKALTNLAAYEKQSSEGSALLWVPHQGQRLMSWKYHWACLKFGSLAMEATLTLFSSVTSTRVKIR